MRTDQLNSTELKPPWIWPRAAYLHIPFCAHHCGYCDFAVTAGQDHLKEIYLDALEMEVARLNEPAPVDTIFIGGGTPTSMSADQLRRLGMILRHWLPLNPGGEFSIESTPDSIDAAKLDVLCQSGLTRISIGVQTFHSHLLPVLDRIHLPETVPSIIRLVQGYPLDISLDLIFGIPGQTMDQWESDLDRAIDFGIDHLSTYGLTYEKGTPLWKQRHRGQIKPIQEELEAEMYARGIKLLTQRGYEHYEISNFAKPGKRCRHNEVYWANHAYFGFGVGAARYVESSRELNCRNTQDYLKKVLAGEDPTFQSEMLTPQERAFETIAIQLRRMQGIHRDDYFSQTGIQLDELIQPTLSHLTQQGLLIDFGSSISLSESGKMLADSIIEKILQG